MKRFIYLAVVSCLFSTGAIASGFYDADETFEQGVESAHGLPRPDFTGRNIADGNQKSPPPTPQPNKIKPGAYPDNYNPPVRRALFQ